MDSDCVELQFSVGTMIAIDAIDVENEIADNMCDCSKLDGLIYNKPFEYADFILNGDLEIYLKGSPEHRLMDFDMPVHTITLENGSEFADYKGIEEDLNTTIYFADPYSPWQRGLNENTNDMIRFFFPKGTDFSKVTEEELIAVLCLLNNRSRKCLDYLSSLEFISKKCCT